MTSLLSIVVIVLLAYTGSVIFKKIKYQSTFIKSIAYTGILYIILGYILSPNVLNVFDVSILENLNILFAFVLGWAGFFIGLQTKLSALRRFPSMYFRYTIINFSIVFLVSFLGFWFLLNTALHIITDYRYLLVLSLAGAISSPIMLAVVIRDYRVHARLAHLLQFQAAFDNVLGVLAIGILEISFGIYTQESLLLVFAEISIVTVLALLAGGVYALLSKSKMNNEEETLYIIGLLMFVVGLSLYFGMSLLLAGLFFGIVIANSTKRSRSLYNSIQHLEKPMYILLLVFAGAEMRVRPAISLILIFFIWRVLAKVMAEVIANQTISKNERHSGWLGFGGIGMGGLPLAIVLDFYFIHPQQESQLLIFVVFVMLVFQDGMALRYLKERLIRVK